MYFGHAYAEPSTYACVTMHVVLRGDPLLLTMLRRDCTTMLTVLQQATRDADQIAPGNDQSRASRADASTIDYPISV